jgi:hypothetical protein
MTGIKSTETMHHVSKHLQRARIKLDYSVLRRAVLTLGSRLITSATPGQRIVAIRWNSSKMTVTEIFIKLRLEQIGSFSAFLAILRKQARRISSAIMTGKFIHDSLNKESNRRDRQPG